MFGLTPEELAVAAAAWASLAGGVLGVFVRAGRILERLSMQEERIARLERVAGLPVHSQRVVKR